MPFHATSANSFEEVLSFNKASYFAVFLFVFELLWLITSQAFNYLMTSIVFILTYIVHIYPMKGFLKISFLKNFEWKNLLYIRGNI